MSDDRKKQAAAARAEGPTGKPAKQGRPAGGRDEGPSAGPPPPRKQDEGSSQAYTFHPSTGSSPGRKSGPDDKEAGAKAATIPRAGDAKEGPPPSEAPAKPAKTGLEFSQPSASPPKQRGLKPDPVKARKLRQAKHGAAAAARPEKAAAAGPSAEANRSGKPGRDQGRKAPGRATGPEKPKPEPGRRSGTASGTALQNTLQPAEPTVHPLFRKRSRTVPLAIALLGAIAMLWWTGVFDKRVDRTLPSEPTQEAATRELGDLEAEAVAASEAAGLLQALGLLEEGAEQSSAQDLEAAIRMYQEMAGLTVDGRVSPELLEDLRAVAEFTADQQ